MNRLNDEGVAKVMEYIDLLLLSDRYQKKEATIIPFRRSIKWSLLSSSAGTGELLDEENFETIEVGEEVPAQADFGLALHGDSMEPRYHDGQAVWVQKTDTLRSGEINIRRVDKVRTGLFRKCKAVSFSGSVAVKSVLCNFPATSTALIA